MSASIATDGLLLWNKLGSADEVANSEVGPDLTLSTNANHTFVDGVFDDALTIGPGGYYSTGRYRNAILSDVGSLLNEEAGAIEVWYNQQMDPVQYSNNPYRIFDGSYGLLSSIAIYKNAPTPDSTRINFTIQRMNGGFISVETEAGNPAVSLSGRNGEWLHLAAVWDRAGIAGSDDTMRLYVDGFEVADAHLSDWGVRFSGDADIGGGNDNNIAGKFALDNLKIWDFAKTDFSDRFVEGVDADETVTLRLGGTGGPAHLPAFRVRADGEIIGQGVIGDPQTMAELRADGRSWADFTFSVDAAPERLEIEFVNDGIDPLTREDVNLFVDRVSFGGETYESETDGWFEGERDVAGRDGPRENLWWNGTLSFEAKTEQVVTVVAAGTGDADVAPQFRVLADGVEIGRGEIAAPAATSAGLAFESFEFRYLDSGPAEEVVVEFLNDQRTPVGGVDVNLYVETVSFGGETYASAEDATYIRAWDGADLGARRGMWWNGSLSFGDRDDTPPGDLLFADDFSGGALSSEWTVVHPNAWVEDGWLHLQDNGSGARNASVSTHDSDPAWTDYSVRCTVDFVDIGWLDSFALVLRAKGYDESNYGSFGSGYQLLAYGPTGWEAEKRNTLVLFEFVDPDTTDRIPGVRSELLRARHDFPTDPFEVVASVEGGRVRAWVEGELVIDHLDPTPRDHGGITLTEMWELRSRYDDIEVVAGSPEEAGWIL